MFVSEPFVILEDRSWDHTTVCSKPQLSSLSLAPSEDAVLHRTPGPPSYQGFGGGSQDALTLGHKRQATTCLVGKWRTGVGWFLSPPQLTWKQARKMRKQHYRQERWDRRPNMSCCFLTGCVFPFNFISGQAKKRVRAGLSNPETVFRWERRFLAIYSQSSRPLCLVLDCHEEILE